MRVCYGSILSRAAFYYEEVIRCVEVCRFFLQDIEIKLHASWVGWAVWLIREPFDVYPSLSVVSMQMAISDNFFPHLHICNL